MAFYSRPMGGAVVNIFLHALLDLIFVDRVGYA